LIQFLVILAEADLQIILHWEITLVLHASKLAMQLVKYSCSVKDVQTDIDRLHVVEHMMKSGSVPIVDRKASGLNKVGLTWFTLEWIPTISPTRRIPTNIMS